MVEDLTLLSQSAGTQVKQAIGVCWVWKILKVENLNMHLKEECDSTDCIVVKPTFSNKEKSIRRTPLFLYLHCYILVIEKILKYDPLSC
jgi:hypothetical protein